MERIVTTLRKVKGALRKMRLSVWVFRALGITEQTYDCWWHEDGGLKVDQGKRLK